jgi:TPR repeat protein
MRLARSPINAAAFILALGSGWTAAPGAARADTTLIDGLTLRTVTRIMAQYTLLAVRTVVDLTYDHLAVDPHTGDVVVTGLNLYPKLDWDQDNSCVVEIGRIASAKKTGFDVIESQMELTGVTVAPSCFEPEQAAMMTAFGYDGLTIDSLSIDTSYEFGSSAADLTIHAAVQDAAAVTITADFDYVWITGLIPDERNRGGDPYPVGLLSEAEISIENRGVFERLEPMLGAQLGDLQAVPQMITAILMDALSDGGTRSPDAAETEFVNNVAGEVGRFISDKNRVVLSVAPPGGVWLTPDIFENPTVAINVLRPVASAAPLVSRSLIAPVELMAAINGQAATLNEEATLRVGAALLSGLGAPRSVAHGQELLLPLASDWHAEASLLLAEALAEDGEDEQAYHLALRAAAGGETRGMTLADNLEETLDPGFVLGAQAASANDWPGTTQRQAADAALIESADIGALRERAHAAALGKAGPRNYADAYYWASLAAAAGDSSSAGLRERLDRRFGGTEGAARDAWKTESQAAAAKAIETWTNGGLGRRVAALYGLAQ